jgi:hypothetical protein
VQTIDHSLVFMKKKTEGPRVYAKKISDLANAFTHN